MPYRFRRRETIAAGVRRIAGEQVERALRVIDDEDLDPNETVHQVRQRCKKIRGLLRIVRPQLGDTYGKENKRLRNAAADLAHLRDAQVSVECFDRLMKQVRKQPERRRFSSVRRQLARQRDEVARQRGDIGERLQVFRKKMRKARSRIKDWPIPADEFDALAGGFEQTYCRAQTALRQAYSHRSTENFHEWRKHVKYHGYHGRLLRGIWPEVMAGYRETADELGNLIGVDHDLAILRARLLDAPDEFGKPREIEAIVRLIDCRRSQLQDEARPLGLRMFAHDPAEVTRWFAHCWTVWRNGKNIPVNRPSLDSTGSVGRTAYPVRPGGL